MTTRRKKAAKAAKITKTKTMNLTMKTTKTTKMKITFRKKWFNKSPPKEHIWVNP